MGWEINRKNIGIYIKFRLIFYLTYNDLPSGIFSSQVIDVVKFFNTELNVKTKLISFISIRNYLSNRKKIKNQLPESIVLPMFPGVHRWRRNIFLLTLISLIKKPDAIIGRSVLATQLALILRNKNRTKKVIYDGRGAINEEWKEYQVVKNAELLSNIFNLEKESVLSSDFQIAVSKQLVNYWKQEFNYEKINHVIIPCTLNKVYKKVRISHYIIESSRRLIGLNNEDIAFIYSGSVSGWQSFNLLYSFIKPLLLVNKNIKLIFLAEKEDNIHKLEQEFKGRVLRFHLKPNEVPEYLLAADYGLLIRENSFTNQVASPVKFAEYLCCGLPVIISERLGDYSEFVEKNGCGYIIKDNVQCISKIKKVSLEEKEKCFNLANIYYSKNADCNVESYKKLIKFSLS